MDKFIIIKIKKYYVKNQKRFLTFGKINATADYNLCSFFQ
jgi:hypothetical protein